MLPWALDVFYKGGIYYVYTSNISWSKGEGGGEDKIIFAFA